MPALWITLDYMDGRSAVKGPLYPDQIDLTGLLFRLNERDLATVTFANSDPFKYLYLVRKEAEKCGGS
jgi:hypothetical protein